MSTGKYAWPGNERQSALDTELMGICIIDLCARRNVSQNDLVRTLQARFCIYCRLFGKKLQTVPKVRYWEKTVSTEKHKVYQKVKHIKLLSVYAQFLMFFLTN